MPGEAEQRPAGAHKNAVAVFEEFACAVQEFHNIEVNHDVINGDRVSKNAKIDRDFSDADQHVLTIGAAEGGVSAITAISVAGSPPPSPLEAATAAAAARGDTEAASSAARSPAAAEQPSRQIPPRSSRRGKLRVRDSNAPALPPQQQQQEIADGGKRQRTTAAAGKKGGDGDQNDTLAWRGPPIKSDEPAAQADKENHPVPRGRGRPPLPKRSKAGVGGAGGGAASSSPAEGSAQPASDIRPEPLRRSGRNSALPPAPPPATRRTRSSGIISAGDSAGGGGGGGGASSSSGGGCGISEKIAELRAKKVSSMKVVDLKAELRKLGAGVGGLKAVLQARLVETINARVSELESSLPLQSGDDDGDVREDAPEEERVAPVPAAATAAENGSSADSGSPARLGRSSVAPGAALGPLTRLSIGRMSSESAAATSPMRASRFFGEEAEQQEATAVAAAGPAAAAPADDDVSGAVESAPQGPASASLEDGESGGEDGGDDAMDVDSGGLESEDGSGDGGGDDREGKAETSVVETARPDQPSAAGAATGPGTRQDNAAAGAASAASVEKEDSGDGDDEAPLSPPAATAAAAAAAAEAEAVVAAAGDADGGVVPVADNVAEVIPEVALPDVSGDNMDEDEEEEEEEEEGEITETAGARDGGSSLGGGSIPDESKRAGGIVPGRAETEALHEVTSAELAGQDGAADAESEPAAVDDHMEVEEARCVCVCVCVRAWGLFPGCVVVPPPYCSKGGVE